MWCNESHFHFRGGGFKNERCIEDIIERISWWQFSHGLANQSESELLSSKTGWSWAYLLKNVLPNSKHKTYVGYEDGPKAIKVYNAEMRKILTLRNFHFLSLSEIDDPPSEGIAVVPNVQCTTWGGVEKVLPSSYDTQRTVSESQKRKCEEWWRGVVAQLFVA